MTGRGRTRATAERPSVVRTDPAERGRARTEGKWIKQQLQIGKQQRNVMKTHEDKQIMIVTIELAIDLLSHELFAEHFHIFLLEHSHLLLS